jgi:hypothetical protein
MGEGLSEITRVTHDELNGFLFHWNDGAVTKMPEEWIGLHAGSFWAKALELGDDEAQRVLIEAVAESLV